IRGLKRESGNQVDVDVRDARTAQQFAIVRHLLRIVASPGLAEFLLDERLHAQAHPVHTKPNPFLHPVGIQRAWRSFQSELTPWISWDLFHNAGQMLWLQQARGAAPEIDSLGGEGPFL